MDGSLGALQLLSAFCLLPVCLSFPSLGIIVPESPMLEIGKEFTATCVLFDHNKKQEGKATADNIFWEFGDMEVDRRHYTKINDSAVSLTVMVTKDLVSPLKCNVRTYELSHESRKNIHGIFFKTGYPPAKPSNITCMVEQENKEMSQIMKCTWDPGTVDPMPKTEYKLCANFDNDSLCVSANWTSGVLKFKVIPVFIPVKIRVEVSNPLGEAVSDVLALYTEDILKLNPPAEIKVTSEKHLPTSLVVQWHSPISDSLKNHCKPQYIIRFCTAGSSTWTRVPEDDTNSSTASFRLQNLLSFTDYVVQMRCKCTSGAWSEWSQNVTAKTPEDKPRSEPDLWRVINAEDSLKPVKVMWKPPVLSNGKILGYNVTLKGFCNESRMFKSSNETEFELPTREYCHVTVIAYNSVGDSPKAELKVNDEKQAVDDVSWKSQEDELIVTWQVKRPAAKFMIDWVSVSDGKRDWRREPSSARQTVLKGILQPYKLYNISVSPVYRASPGKPYTVQAYLQQDAPNVGPSVTTGRVGKDEAELQWLEIPLSQRNGFITGYTIFYVGGGTERSITVGPNVHFYKLDSLSSGTKYVVRVLASTVVGSRNSSDLAFNTAKYAVGEVEAIVVSVCIGFLFIMVMTLAFCINKKTVIKKCIWPHIPDPSNSTIANWSPDFPSRPETPKEGSMTDVSVVEVDAFDKKSTGEEDKASPHLKKDKYMSDEHSSGIGGSSGLSTPRQSVSDCDEGDSGQTTGSTVQYSSVVTSGYKGQTPAALPPTFARSESTQPLLDCEERPDEPHGQDSGGHAANPYFKKLWAALEDGPLAQTESKEHSSTSLNFCPTEDEPQEAAAVTEGLLAEAAAGAATCYMAQVSGYRPQ